jgi:hypothetical protein
MKPLKDREEVEEVDLKDILEEKETEEEDQVYSTTVVMHP